MSDNINPINSMARQQSSGQNIVNDKEMNYEEASVFDGKLPIEAEKYVRQLFHEYSQSDVLNILDEEGRFPETLAEMNEIYQKLYNADGIKAQVDDLTTSYYYDEDGDGEFDRIAHYQNSNGEFVSERFRNQSKSTGEIYHMSGLTSFYSIAFDGKDTQKGDEYYSEAYQNSKRIEKSTVEVDETTGAKKETETIINLETGETTTTVHFDEKAK